MNTQTVILDVDKRYDPSQVVTIGQGDKSGTTIVAEVYDKGVSVSLSGYTAEFEMRLPDGRNYVRDNDCTVSGNTITYVVDEEHCGAAAGHTNECYFNIKSGSSVIYSTSRFRMDVLRAAHDGAVPSESWDSAIEEAIENANEAAEEAREAAGGTVPLMSATQRGGAKLGDGLALTGEALGVDPQKFAPLTSGAVAISKGGTGATTAAAARANLEVVKDSAIAYVESTTAKTNHAVGDYFMLGNVLMKATAAIAAGETINASKATPATVQGQIDTLRDSVVYSRYDASASINRMSDGTQQFGVLATTAEGHRVAFIVQTNGLTLYDWQKSGGAGEVWNFLTPNVFMGRGSNPSSLTSLDSTNIEAGAYWVNNTYVGGTWPTNRTWGMLLVFMISVSSTLSTQIFVGEGVFYFRQYVNNGWSEWRRLTHAS